MKRIFDGKGIQALVAALLVHSAAMMQAESLVLEPLADTAFLYSPTPPFRQNLVNGGRASIGASLHSGAPDRGSCTLMRFDLSKIPAGATITKAELILTPVFTYSPSVFSGNEKLVVRQLAPENAEWTEGGGESLGDPDNAPLQAPGANGAYVNMEVFDSEESHDGVRWLSGTNFGRMDMAEGDLGRMALAENGLTKNLPVQIELDPGAVQTWLKDQALAKAGLVLWMESDEATVPESRFAIFQSRDQENPPQLTLEFTKP